MTKAGCTSSEFFFAALRRTLADAHNVAITSFGKASIEYDDVGEIQTVRFQPLNFDSEDMTPRGDTIVIEKPRAINTYFKWEKVDTIDESRRRHVCFDIETPSGQAIIIDGAGNEKLVDLEDVDKRYRNAISGLLKGLKRREPMTVQEYAESPNCDAWAIVDFMRVREHVGASTIILKNAEPT
ncbi:MAG: hypothetical protein ACRBCT_00740 [Alphaproteobacteria bacterium]